ncbi:hypothetical protein RJT34_23306 [Clitoria ternatea]|uniref:Uncharacterized protein n=1 Tax=Clitoria ternatea TaxID=43366 RepID=A0AAN9FRU1_CLITE
MHVGGIGTWVVASIGGGFWGWGLFLVSGRGLLAFGAGAGVRFREGGWWVMVLGGGLGMSGWGSGGGWVGGGLGLGCLGFCWVGLRFGFGLG